VDPAQQKARDSDARAILEAELRRAEARLADLQREYNNGQPEKRGDELRNVPRYQERVADLKAGIARAEADITGIRRELQRAGGGAANAAAGVSSR
jgi:molecular chaperone GrpE (heat shock protein)